MCGVLGLFGLMFGSDQEARNFASDLTRKLRHRGPDWSGFRVYPLKNGKYSILCHERLAIVDPTSGEQPLYGCQDKVCVSANGEIYNHKKLREELEGHELHTQSDCEVLAHLYEKDGPDFANKLDGMFAFILFDPETELFFAYRDYIGICPLYIGYGPRGEVYFSSEMKAIVDISARLQVFPPGSWYSSETRNITRYYTPHWWNPSVVPTGQLDLAMLRQKLEKAVTKRMMTDVPFGVLLSGGLDSSIISALVVKHSQNRTEDGEQGPAWYPQIHSFAIGLRGSPDLHYAAIMAKHLKTVHHEFLFTAQQGIDALSEVIYHTETYNVTTIRASTPMYFMARKIKSMGVKMVLSGEGADEVFAGYLYFHKAPSKEELHSETVRKVQDLHQYDLLRANKSMMAFGVEPRVPFLDKEMLDYSFSIDPAEKMPTGNERSIEKYILRKAFEDLLPPDICWRQKEQFSDGVGYNWIDSLKQHADMKISDEMMANAAIRFAVNPPATKEAYLIRDIFEKHFPTPDAVATVPGTPSVACSTAKALEWDEAFRRNADESGRAVLGVHSSAKQFEDAQQGKPSDS